jgi:protein-lysine N-methyltransferase EEF2KMT
LNNPLQDLPDYVDLESFHTATVLESRTTIESGTTGFRTWFASYVLSQYLIMHPGICKFNNRRKCQNADTMISFSESITSKRVLELGSGVGFLGIIVATLQQLELSSKTANARLTISSPGSLWLTDLNDEVLSRCRDNLNLPCSEYLLIP